MTDAPVAGTVTCTPDHPLQATRVPALKFIKSVDFPLTVIVGPVVCCTDAAPPGATAIFLLFEAPQPAAMKPRTASSASVRIGDFRNRNRGGRIRTGDLWSPRPTR